MTHLLKEQKKSNYDNENISKDFSLSLVVMVLCITSSTTDVSIAGETHEDFSETNMLH